MDFKTKEELNDLLMVEGAVDGNTFNYRSNLHHPGEYLLFASHSGFAQEQPVALAMFNE